MDRRGARAADVDLGAARQPRRVPGARAARESRGRGHGRHRGVPPEVLSIRGKAEITEVDGVVPEYAQAAHRFLGSEEATAYLGQIDHPSTRMARVAVRPTWVGLLDFQTRLPSALGGTSGEPR